MGKSSENILNRHLHLFFTKEKENYGLERHDGEEMMKDCAFVCFTTPSMVILYRLPATTQRCHDFN